MCGVAAKSGENNSGPVHQVDSFFLGRPAVRLIFDALSQIVLRNFPEVIIKVQKSQISFCGPRPFCWAWLPIRDGIKGRPELYLVVSFGLDHEIIHPRLVDTSQPYPGRWTHHTIISHIEEIDAELINWISQAYQWKNADRDLLK